MPSEIGDRRAGDARRLLAQAHYELHKKATGYKPRTRRPGP